MSGALEKHEYLDILDCPVYYLSTSIRCDWFPCQAKWELYQMGALPYKINGNYKRREPYRQRRNITGCIF